MSVYQGLYLQLYVATLEIGCNTRIRLQHLSSKGLIMLPDRKHAALKRLDFIAAGSRADSTSGCRGHYVPAAVSPIAAYTQQERKIS